MIARKLVLFASCVTVGTVISTAPSLADRPMFNRFEDGKSPTVFGDVFRPFRQSTPPEEVFVEESGGATVRATPLPPEARVALRRTKLKKPDGLDAAAEAIFADLSTAGDNPVRVRKSHLKPVLAFYAERNYAPMWTGDYGLSLRARRALKVLATADEDGLRAVDFLPASLTGFDDDGTGQAASPAARARLDLEMTASVLEYARVISAGAVDPFRISDSHDLKVEEEKPGDILARLAVSVRPDSYLLSLHSQIPQYAAMKDALARYREMEKNRSDTEVPPGAVLRPGTSDPRVPLLRRRLAELGHLSVPERTDDSAPEATGAIVSESASDGTTVAAAPEKAADGAIPVTVVAEISPPATAASGETANSDASADNETEAMQDTASVSASGESDETAQAVPAVGDDVYGPELADAIRAFQKQADLGVDGVVGPRTLAALNGRSVESQIARVKLNLERLRWLPRSLADRHVFVNQAFFQAWIMDDGRKVYRTDVIVGKPNYQTAVFMDEMETVIFNPYWHVPRSIAANEMLPHLRVDPTYLARQGYEVVDVRGQITDSTRIDWTQYNQETLPYDIRQPPGPRNALGRVKFLFPNRHAIYMHDTPARSLFSRTVRAFSHGCIRVGTPIKFARAILGVEGWSAEEVDRAIASSERQEVTLKRKVPVYIGYYTAWPDDDGTMKFRNDIYSRDRVLTQAFEQNRRVYPTRDIALN